MTVGRAAADAAFFVLLLLALAAWPPSVLPALALVNAPLIVTANLAQILQNRRNRSTGELSALTVLLRWLGAVVRVGTTLWQLKGDRAVLLNHTLGVLCTSTLLAQLWWYGRTDQRWRLASPASFSLYALVASLQVVRVQRVRRPRGTRAPRPRARAATRRRRRRSAR